MERFSRLASPITLSPDQLQGVLRRCADRVLDWDFGVWFGGDAIPMDALLDAADVLNEEQWASEVYRHVRRWVERTEQAPITWPDQMTPGWATVRIGVRFGDQRVIAAAERLAQFMDDVPRSRWLSLPLRFPHWPNLRDSVLVDSLYYDGTFHYALAHATGNEAYFERGSRIMEAVVIALHGSSSSGVFPHAVNTATRDVFGDGWGRGSGYALLGLVDALDILPPSRPEHARLSGTLAEVATRLLPLQDSTGFWRTILHNREAYLETSTASFFTAVFAKGIRLGLLDEATFREPAERALAGLLTRVDDEGRVFGVSGLSFPDEEAAYLRIPTEVNSWGQGAAVRALAEWLRLHAASR
jgi:unsaturated rhamnogalacturonyl hydrolase